MLGFKVGVAGREDSGSGLVNGTAFSGAGSWIVSGSLGDTLGDGLAVGRWKRLKKPDFGVVSSWDCGSSSTGEVGTTVGETSS